MKSKALIAMAVAAAFSSASVVLASDKFNFYSEASEENPMRGSAELITGGYKGWGPMANPVSPAADMESTVVRDQDLMKEREQHLAEVNQQRDSVWAHNASLREPYTSRQAFAAATTGQTAVGATRSEGGGILRFFRRDK